MIDPVLAGRQMAGEMGLDEPQPQGIIGIAFRQREDGMQVIGQHHDGIHRERMPCPHVAKGHAR